MRAASEVDARAVAGRRKCGREEWRTQTRLAEMLGRLLDPRVFWSSLENRPRSRLSGLLARRRGTRAGLPDIMVIFRGRSNFVELKSPSGRPSPTQRRIRAELVAADCQWWMARSARAALVALHRSGVPFRRPWKEPATLRAWEGPFTGEEKRLPQHPLVREKQRLACRRWREKRRAQGLSVRRPRRAATDERRAQVREATRRWRERKRARALEAAAARDDGAPLAASEPASA